MTLTPGRGYPQTGVAAFTTRQRSAVDGGDQATPLDQLTGEQASAAVGDPIPLVFCDRIDGVGGVWVDPPATEARYENDANDTLTVSYQLVISDGEIGGLSSVWQGQQLRAGPGAVATPERPLAVVDWSYDGRTGTWQPGNFVTQNWKLSTSTNTQEVTGAAVASEAELEDAKARITLTSKSDYVTRFEFTAVMIDWGSRVPAGISGSASTGEGSSGPSLVSTFVDDTKPLRNLGNWSFSRERSLEPQRIELEHVEDVYWDGEFIPRAVYRGTTVEESIEPSRILEIPEFTGSGRGSYAGLSTLSYTDTYTVGNDTWGQQVHVFIENGVQVPLLLGPGDSHSNLLPDLARYLLLRRSVPVDLIDVDALMDAALFNRENGLLFNGVLAIPSNLRDWLHRIAPFYLLRVTNRQGKIGLRPAVPTYGTGEIALDPVTPAFTFTEDHIIPGSFRQELIGVGERRAFTALMQWREQPLDQVGIPRATEVRRADADPDAPVEVFDLTECCVTEDHAVKAAIYQLSRRQHVTHTLTIDVVPDPAVAALGQGDVVRVTYLRMVAGVGSTVHDFFYELEEVTTTDEGAVTLKLSHYPVTDAGESVFALEVARGASLREGFAWQANAAEYGNSLVFAGEGADENLDDVKDPPIPYGATATFSPPVIDEGANTILVKVCMDKPAQTQDMNLRLVSQLIAFNNQTIRIGIGQQCGEVELPLPSQPGTVGLLGYTGGGYVNPDLTDTITIGEVAPTMGMFWLYDQFQGGVHGVNNWTSGNPNASGFLTADTYRFKIGSGDGTQWVTATINTTGINAMRTAAVDDINAVGPDQGEVRMRGVLKITALPLPCGNGAAVCLVRAERAAAFAGWWGVEAFDYPGNSNMYWQTGTYTTRSASANGFKCFLVSYTTCRELTPPAAFSAAVSTMFPAVQWGNTEAWTYRPTYEPGAAIGLGPKPDFTIEPEVIYIPSPTYTSSYDREQTEAYTLGKPTGGAYNMSGVFEVTTTTINFNRTLTYAPAEITLQNQLLTSFGFKVDLMEAGLYGYFQTNASATPSVLPFFTNQADGLTSAGTLWDDAEISYSAHSTALTALGQTTPGGVITIDHRTPQMEFVNAMATDEPLYYATPAEVENIPFVTYESLPTDGPDTVPTEATYADLTTLPFTATRTDPYAGDTPDVEWPYLLTPFFFTDWGNPDYCRDQLIALGFTGADLTP